MWCIVGIQEEKGSRNLMPYYLNEARKRMTIPSLESPLCTRQPGHKDTFTPNWKEMQVIPL